MPVFVIHQCSECKKEHRRSDHCFTSDHLPAGWRKDDDRLFCGVACHLKHLQRLHLQETCQHPMEQRQYRSPGSVSEAMQASGKWFTCGVCGIKEVEYPTPICGPTGGLA